MSAVSSTLLARAATRLCPLVQAQPAAVAAAGGRARPSAPRRQRTCMSCSRCGLRQHSMLLCDAHTHNHHRQPFMLLLLGISDAPSGCVVFRQPAEQTHAHMDMQLCWFWHICLHTPGPPASRGWLATACCAQECNARVFFTRVKGEVAA